MIAEVERIVSNPRHKYEYGCDARFVFINKQWGFKYFRNESMRDWTHEMQSLAWEYNMAPRIGVKHDIMIPDSEFGDQKMYGYITEVAKPLGYDMTPEEQGQQRWLYNHLIAFFAEMSIGFCDMHPYNCGWLNRKLVCFDFSGCFRKPTYDF